MTAKTEEADSADFEFVEKQLKAPFSPNKIKWRASNFNGNKSSALLYLDARDVMDRLDEVFGIGRWMTDYTDLETRCVCKLSVSFNGWGWTHKSDVGTQSTFEGEKGMYSDALKRAAVQFGVGRYLYDDDILENKSFAISDLQRRQGTRSTNWLNSTTALLQTRRQTYCWLFFRLLQTLRNSSNTTLITRM